MAGKKADMEREGTGSRTYLVPDITNTRNGFQWKLKGRLSRLNIDSRIKQPKRMPKNGTPRSTVKFAGKECRRDKRRFIDNLALEAETAATQHRVKDLYQTTRKLTGKQFATSKPIKDAARNKLTNKVDQLRRWV